MAPKSNTQTDSSHHRVVRGAERETAAFAGGDGARQRGRKGEPVLESALDGETKQKQQKRIGWELFLMI